MLLASPQCICDVNGDLGFSLREIKEIIGLPILVEIYEEYFPIGSEIEVKNEEFWALFFQLLALFECTKGSRDCPKSMEWYGEWYKGTKGESTFFKSEGLF